MEREDLKKIRDRMYIYVLDNKLESYRTGFTEKIYFDNKKDNQGMRTREVCWRLYNHEFLVTYHEFPEIPGSAQYRIRTQPYIPGETQRNWEDLATFGELEALLRKAATEKGYTSGDLKAQRGSKKRMGQRPEGMIMETITGSHAYGLNHEGLTDYLTGEAIKPSDLDTRGVFAWPTQRILSIRQLIPKGEDNIKDENSQDSVYDEVGRFVQFCANTNPDKLETLYGPKLMLTDEGSLLVDNKHHFMSKQILRAYGGYASGQIGRIERDPQRETKPAMHVIRLLIMGARILRTGEIDTDLSPYRDKMMAIRTREMNLNQVLDWYQELQIEIAKAAEESKLPDWPNFEAINTALLEIRGQLWKKST